MTPAKLEDHPTWSVLAKWSIGLIGALLTIVVGWAARAAERQATAFDELKEAVYSSQTKSAVLETKVEAIDSRVRVIEAKMDKEK